MAVPGENLPGQRLGQVVRRVVLGPPRRHPPSASPVSARSSRSGSATSRSTSPGSCARRPPSSHPTDMPDSVLNELRGHVARDVWIVGRRGPQHASFTTPELRELLTLPHVQPVVHDELDEIDLTTLERRPRANVEAMKIAAERSVPDASLRLHLLFWHRPVEVEGRHRVAGTHGSSGRPWTPRDASSVPARSARSSASSSCARSGTGGTRSTGVPFDEARGIIPNTTRPGDRHARPDPAARVRSGLDQDGDRLV
jgi:ferredoxin--NADP+ reductase